LNHCVLFHNIHFKDLKINYGTSPAFGEQGNEATE